MPSERNQNGCATFSHRACYVNFAEHLQNRWNPNLLYHGAPNQWSDADWRAFLTMLRAFGFNCFEYWVVPTLFSPAALQHECVPAAFAASMRRVTDIAHSLGLKTKALIIVNCIGAEWFFACPNEPEQRRLILQLWSHWTRALCGTDIVSIFPGDPGGCNRNGCTHETFIELALELCGVIQKENPGARVELNTWGPPFSGWGSDLRETPGWDGSWKMLTDPKHNSPPIWLGKPERARAAMEYLLKRLPEFPDDMMVAINIGFSPDGEATHGGDARPWAREIAKLRPIVSWDYSVSEGELICYPHWRLPRMAARRREERSAAPYAGGMCYTMSPKLNLLTLYAAGQLFLNPDADPDALSREFCRKVFGEEHARLGELFEAFEVVRGWGHYPRRQWSKKVLRVVYAEIIERLEAADVSRGSLPLLPDPETYRADLLWFARMFYELAGEQPDRTQIRKAYWKKALSIYDSIPMPADERAEYAAQGFSEVLMRKE
jgi:hypothetical protein